MTGVRPQPGYLGTSYGARRQKPQQSFRSLRIPAFAGMTMGGVGVLGEIEQQRQFVIPAKAGIQVSTRANALSVAVSVACDFGPLRRRREAQGRGGLLSEDCLSEASSAAPLGPSIAGQCEAPPYQGVFFFGYFLLHKQKKVTRP